MDCVGRNHLVPTPLLLAGLPTARSSTYPGHHPAWPPTPQGCKNPVEITFPIYCSSNYNIFSITTEGRTFLCVRCLPSIEVFSFITS